MITNNFLITTNPTTRVPSNSYFLTPNSYHRLERSVHLCHESFFVSHSKLPCIDIFFFLGWKKTSSNNRQSCFYLHQTLQFLKACSFQWKTNNKQLVCARFTLCNLRHKTVVCNFFQRTLQLVKNYKCKKANLSN